MQTFLPLSSFYWTANCLDKQRLNKQIVECQQIINCLNDGGAWQNHPAVRMWELYQPALVLYAEACVTVWATRRGGSWEHRSWLSICERVPPEWLHTQPKMPDWLGDERLHSSHRSRLLHKGNLDRLAKRARLFVEGGTKEIEKWIKNHLELSRKTAIRDLSVAQSDQLHQYLDELGITDYDNHYEQFNWTEQPNDDYHWPVPLLS